MTLNDITDRLAASQERHKDHRWLALAVIGVAQLMIILDASIVTIALPHAQTALHISDANRQWVQTAYTLAFGGLLLLGGRIADYFGRKRTFIIGLLGFGAASALGGAAQSSAWLFGARALQGAIAALLAPAVLSLITTTFTETHERAKAFAVYGAISGTGAAIGLILGGALTEYLSWRWTMYVNVPIAIAVAIAALPLIRESRAEGDRRYDVIGAITATLGLALLVYGFTNAATDSWTAPLTLALIGISLALLVTFVVWEQWFAKNPLLPLRIILDRTRGGAYLSFFLATLGMFAVFLFLTFYMQNVHGWSPLKSGFAFLPFPIGVITSATIASKTLPKLGPRPLGLIGFTMGTAGLAWLTTLHADSSYITHLVPSMLLISLGMGQVFVSMSSTALIGVPGHDAGVASALVNTMQQVGGSLGLAFLNTIATTASATYIKDHHALPGTPSYLEGLTHGFTVAFTISAIIFAIAAVVVTLLVRAGRDEVAPQAEGVADGVPEPALAG
ncbi:MAG: MFS transporter [Actinomycetes bacterium]